MSMFEATVGKIKPDLEDMYLVLRSGAGSEIAFVEVEDANGQSFSLGEVVKNYYGDDESFFAIKFRGVRPACLRCYDAHWVCEVHTDKPWDAVVLSGGCEADCIGPGMPCPDCRSGV